MRAILIGLTILSLGFTPALIGASSAAPPAHAEERGKGKEGKGKEEKGKEEKAKQEKGKDGRGKQERAEDDDAPGAILSEVERAILNDYFRTGEDASKGHKGLPPGLAKRDTLPPGLAMQLERNGRLPPGLDARALPADLEDRLPARKGTQRVIVDNDVVLIEEGSRVILDILRGAAGGR